MLSPQETSQSLTFYKEDKVCTGAFYGKEKS